MPLSIPAKPEVSYTNLPMIWIDEPGDSGPQSTIGAVAGGIIGEGSGEQILGEGGEPLIGE